MKEQMDRRIKINAGIACLDRANEVEPRPNEETKAQNAKPRRGEMCITDGEAQRNRRYNRGIACSDRANEVEPRPNEDKARAESPKSIAQGNALCNELHLSPSSPERAKSFVNNRLRSERRYVFNPVNLVNPINHGSDNMLGCFASLAMTNRRKHSIHN